MNIMNFYPLFLANKNIPCNPMGKVSGCLLNGQQFLSFNNHILKHASQTLDLL